MTARSAAPCTLVTGASSGLGQAVAERLAPGRRLILHGRDADRLEALRGALGESAGHLVWREDFRDASGVGASLARVLSDNAVTVESFVHCAGAVQVLAARAAAVGQVRESLEVNYVSAQQIVATLLVRRVNDGTLRNVVIVSSIWSRFGAKGHSLYCAATAALDGMVRALAVELAPAVRVNSVLPGAVETPMSRKALDDPEVLAGLHRNYPLGLGTPRDVAEIVAFLLSEEARWITGQEFVVDGGRTVNMSLK